MEKKKFTTTLSIDTIKLLNIIAAVNDLNGLNSAIEFLVKNYIEESELGGLLDAIKENK